jgi:hypothetical protein
MGKSVDIGRDVITAGFCWLLSGSNNLRKTPDFAWDHLWKKSEKPMNSYHIHYIP